MMRLFATDFRCLARPTTRLRSGEIDARPGGEQVVPKPETRLISCPTAFWQRREPESRSETGPRATEGRISLIATSLAKSETRLEPAGE